MNPAGLRKNYSGAPLRRKSLRSCPVEQFRSWFEAACQAGIPEPNAMVLATADPQGRPWARTVLLKGYDREGFLFFTNLRSRKALHISGQPQVSLLFPWVALERQVMINGEAQALGAEESLPYFSSRPRESRISAWASPQSRPVDSRSRLDRAWEEARDRFGEAEIPLPPHWGGYRVRPCAFEFWQGGPHRIHDRFLYTLGEGGGWRIERLAP